MVAEVMREETRLLEDAVVLRIGNVILTIGDEEIEDVIDGLDIFQERFDEGEKTIDEVDFFNGGISMADGIARLNIGGTVIEIAAGAVQRLREDLRWATVERDRLQCPEDTAPVDPVDIRDGF